MEARDRLLQRDPLRLVTTRKSLKTVASCLAEFETTAKARKFLDTLIEELTMLRQKDTSSMAWRQVTAGVDGIKLYCLEQLDLLPKPEEE